MGVDRGGPKKISIDYVRNYMDIKSVKNEMTTDRIVWKKKTCSTDLT